MTLEKYVQNNRCTILVKTGAPKTAVLGYDEARDAIKIAVAAQPENNKANVELIKFLQKKLKKECEIVSGKASKKKVVRCI